VTSPFTPSDDILIQQALVDAANDLQIHRRAELIDIQAKCLSATIIPDGSAQT